MPVRLNVVKSTITPQIKTASKKTKVLPESLYNSTLIQTRKLRDYGAPDPGAEDKDGSVAKSIVKGAIGGATVGAAIGSGVPVVGSLVGGALGGLIGIAVGSLSQLFKD